MKTKQIILACLLLSTSLLMTSAQEKTTTQSESRSLAKIEENSDHTTIEIPGIKMEVNNYNDTITKITLGHKRFEIIEDHNRSRIRMVRIPREKFKGHWAGVDLGFNGFMNSDFKTSPPVGGEFMDLNQGKSVSIGLNFLQYSIDLQRHKNNIGLVTGLGWTFYNYRTDSQYIIEKDNVTGNTIGRYETDKNVKKNKITASFINIPLLLEFQIPAGQDHNNRFFLSAGGYCGFKLGSHTKVVYGSGSDKNKDKNRGDINMRPFQYGAMVRVGYRFIKLYGTYNFSTFYADNKGPELYPYTIGLTLINF